MKQDQIYNRTIVGQINTGLSFTSVNSMKKAQDQQKLLYSCVKREYEKKYPVLAEKGHLELVVINLLISDNQKILHDQHDKYKLNNGQKIDYEPISKAATYRKALSMVNM